jgi:hypothetical protein
LAPPPQAPSAPQAATNSQTRVSGERMYLSFLLFRSRIREGGGYIPHAEQKRF